MLSPIAVVKLENSHAEWFSNHYNLEFGHGPSQLFASLSFKSSEIMVG